MQNKEYENYEDAESDDGVLEEFLLGFYERRWKQKYEQGFELGFELGRTQSIYETILKKLSS